MAKTPYKLILIEWVDSSFDDSGWKPIEEIGDPSKLGNCLSVGWLVKDADGFKTLAASLDQLGNGSCVISIPDRVIISIRPLRANRTVLGGGPLQASGL